MFILRNADVKASHLNVGAFFMLTTTKDLGLTYKMFIQKRENDLCSF